MSIASEYVINLELEDKSKDAIRSIESQLRKIGRTAKESVQYGDMADSLKQAQKASSDMIDELGRLSKDSSIDFDAVIKSYSRNSKKAIGELENQYVVLKQSLSEITKQEKELNDLIASGADDSKRKEAALKLSDLYKQNKIISTKELEARIHQNREIRASLKSAEAEARAKAKYNKLEDLQAKRKAATDKAEKKALDEKIKRQEALVKVIEKAEVAQKACEKTQKAVTKAIQNSEKAQSRFNRFGEKAKNALQAAYNISGLAGGVGRLAAGGMRIATSGLSMVSQASDKALEREHAANRVKGIDSEKANAMLGDVYVKTGADYSTIVDAINRVRSVLGNVSNDELAQAAAIEVRYPGMALAFASSKTQATMQNVNAYANRIKEIQKASGASDEQIQESATKMANYKSEAFNNTSISEMQAIYLGLQNSGAFESKDELDKAFDKFVRSRKDSTNAAWEDAQKYDWTKTMSKSRDKLQIVNTLQKNMDWKAIGAAVEAKDTSKPAQSTAEKNAERMRTLEERKNQMLIKLIDIVEPIVNEISKALDSDRIKKLIDGIINFLTKAVPILAEVIVKMAERLGILIEKVPEVIDRFVESNTNASENTTGGMIGPKYANGGIALGPSLVGERGPEAIIPLDYSRAQRADNIATSITQTFNMGSGATTAMSLAQAVRSRDFTRAMSENAYISKRCGVFG